MCARRNFCKGEAPNKAPNWRKNSSHKKKAALHGEKASHRQKQGPYVEFFPLGGPALALPLQAPMILPYQHCNQLDSQG